jgi:hypothetical protein
MEGMEIKMGKNGISIEKLEMIGTTSKAPDGRFLTKWKDKNPFAREAEKTNAKDRAKERISEINRNHFEESPFNNQIDNVTTKYTVLLSYKWISSVYTSRREFISETIETRTEIKYKK